MSDQGWKYVNGAMMPTCLPLSEADTSVFNDKNLWKNVKKQVILLAWCIR